MALFLNFSNEIQRFDRALVIIRNPLDAAISEFNRLQFSRKHGGNIISLLANNYLPLQTFLDENFAKHFNLVMDYWMKFHNMVLKYCTNNCHIVVYEDLKSNLINEMKDILNFLGFSMNETIKECLESNSGGKYKRKDRPNHELKQLKSYFSDEELSDIEELYKDYLFKFKQNFSL